MTKNAKDDTITPQAEPRVIALAARNTPVEKESLEARQQRLESLRDSIRSGEYRVPASEIAEKLLDRMKAR